MKDMSPGLRRLIDDARPADEPTAADRARVRAALVAGLAAGGGAATGAATGGKLGLMGRLGIVALVGALLAGGVWWVVSSNDEGAGSVATVPVGSVEEGTREWKDRPAAAAADAAPVEVAPVDQAEAAPAIRTRPAPRATRKPRTRDAAQLAEEARLLREAETARRGGDIALATGRLDEHRRRFPQGALATEREAARILVLCDAGRTAEAKKLAARFLRRHARSPLADRVRSACDRPIP